MALVKRDTSGRTWVKLPVEAPTPLAPRHTPYAPARELLTVTVTSLVPGQARGLPASVLPAGVDFSSRPGNPTVVTYETLKSQQRAKRKARLARMEAGRLAKTHAAETAAEERRKAMAAAFGMFRDKDVFPKDGLAYELETRAEW